MRDDLDFLYQKAMRSSDLEFINEVVGLLSEVGFTLWWDELDNLMERAEFFHNVKFDGDDFRASDRFSIIVGDSQRGADWYRNR